MSHFDELMEAGRKMSEKDIKANIASLGTDPRFAAVLGFLERRRGPLQSLVSNPNIADKPGQLAHVAGGLNEAIKAIEQFRGIIEPSPKRGPEQPENS